MDLRERIGIKIYDLRMDQGLSQEEFVNKLDIHYSRANLSNVENCITIPSAEFIYSVCKAYHISSDWLLSLNAEKYLTQKEQSFLDKFKKLDIEIQQNILNLMDSINKNK